jgi:hypothetical protein
MIRRYIIWRNNHAYDERLRKVVARDALDRAFRCRGACAPDVPRTILRTAVPQVSGVGGGRAGL